MTIGKLPFVAIDARKKSDFIMISLEKTLDKQEWRVYNISHKAQGKIRMFRVAVCIDFDFNLRRIYYEKSVSFESP